MEDQRAQLQRLRALVAAQRRAVEGAERACDVAGAMAALRELSGPLRLSGGFDSRCKQMFLDALYREVAGFVLGFVATRIEALLSDAQRAEAIDAFFDAALVPPAKAVAALASVLSATSATAAGKSSEDADDAAVTIGHCIRLLERIVRDGRLQEVVELMLEQEMTFLMGGEQRRVVSHVQTLVAHLGSLPDLIHNSRERDAPSVFRPRRYFPMLCDSIFAAFGDLYASNQQSRALTQSLVLRILSEKIIRVGQVAALVQSWLRVIEDNRRTNGSVDVPLHELLLCSLPEACYPQFFLQLAKEPGQELDAKTDTAIVLTQPKYALISLIPGTVISSQQFQYVLAHKLLLKTPINDFFVWRVLVDTIITSRMALIAVFDTVLAQWSQSDFASSTDYSLNASVTFFLRYAMHKMIESEQKDFDSRDWTAKLCKGVQDHMSHSVERVRTLGMRVGETLSKLLSPEHVLDFGITTEDPLTLYGRADTTVGIDATQLNQMTEAHADEIDASSGAQSGVKRRSKKNRPQTLFSLDPDAVVMSDDEEGDGVYGASGSEEEMGDSDVDSDSDMSLEAYDLADDERDLQAKRPVYLKDLISALMAEDDREKTEAALGEAELLLRRRPRDLHENVREVVTALLRLENKYNTDNFVALRANALSAACTLSPGKTVPYFLSQALEREQLLQSRLDILQAMVRASQELSETGEFRVSGPKSLLQSPRSTSDLDTATMASFKTRRFGYRRDPLAPVKKNAFAPHALSFFSPLLFGYIDYRQKLGKKDLNDVEHIFLAHLLHALASFVESAGNSPQTISMAKCLVEFAWVERDNKEAAVRRQVLFSVSRVLLVVPPFLLRQELGESIVEILTWLQQVARQDPDDGCREASRLLLSSSNIPTLALQ